MKIVIVDYGMGNIRSLMGALKHVGGGSAVVSSSHDELRGADRLIVPGVGAFGNAMGLIRAKGLDGVIRELALEKGVPVLGICLGMQLLGKSSDEGGSHEGLGLVEGDVRRFEGEGLKVPHVGFNQVRTGGGGWLYSGFGESADFYFTHSHRMVGGDGLGACFCDYGGDFIASFEVGNIAGVQFHPELSQRNGLRLLRNFVTPEVFG
jgi:glutamine amidotransferase